MNYYFCDACRYCFSAEQLPDRCPDCGAVAYNDRLAVRLATDTEIAELLRIRANSGSSERGFRYKLNIDSGSI